MKYLQKNGFFAFCVGLCGLLLGLTGCASVKNVMKKTSAAFSGFLEQSAPKKRQEDAQKHDGKKAKELAKIFPRKVEAQYLARLDGNRQVISAPLGGAIPTNSIPNWDSALYYAIRPEARKVLDPNFDASAYAVDLDADTVEILDTAYEAEPFTGTVIVTNHEQRLVAYINRGIMVETGSKWDVNATKRLRNQYDESGTLRASSTFDENGTLRLTNLYDENGSVKEDLAYYPSGIVSQQKIYREGEIIETRQFDEKGKRDIHRELSILVSDVRIRVQQLGLYSNPTQDNVMKIYDKRELAENPEQPFAFTGKVVEFYDEEYKIPKRREDIKGGLYDGTSIWWHSNGKKEFEAEYAKGVLQGRTAWYREDGSVAYEGEWKDNKLEWAKTYDINHDLIGKEVIDGNGTLTYLYPNGQSRLEETYTDGKLTETKWWDEEGNPIESVEARFIPYYRRHIK
jgi:antitoxin component YwqK of YwqJK toxin-antitoxin module